MGIADTSIAAASAAFSGLAAFGAWKASRQANGTAASVAQIERDRWHNALTPQLRLKLEQSDGLLYVRFDGPAQLGRLSIRLIIRDDFDRTGVPGLAGGPTPDEIAQVVWGPTGSGPESTAPTNSVGPSRRSRWKQVTVLGSHLTLP
ncbi:hypothetical protein A6P39_000045 [Streptomyces sp. FXJ1.172]|uniref:hypothetical protein n=1 Tax=Streptomyces sp. FXJ1.172 TaxID=710705 RepID=UPI0023DD624E|nr:hypothetical protein [Streptomyces sp. FXJ1.172]WEO92651.1 hypothetical protein A6P39_000045 [Streptomyces sp. FXJ1.172]